MQPLSQSLVCFHSSMSDGSDVKLSAGEEDDEDDLVDEDMEALRVGCRLAGVNPEEYINPLSSSPAAGNDSDDVDDFELVRNIRKQFAIADDGQSMSTLPPVSPDEEKDDFETLRRIQRRFGAYESGRFFVNVKIASKIS